MNKECEKNGEDDEACEQLDKVHIGVNLLNYNNHDEYVQIMDLSSIQILKMCSTIEWSVNSMASEYQAKSLGHFHSKLSKM